MSSNTWVNTAIGVVAGLVVGYFVGPVMGYQTYAAIAGLTAGSLTISYLNGKYATPKAPGAGLGRGILGRAATNGVKDAASQSLSINSSSESVSIPVPFGKVRIPGNFLRYDASTFRVVPIIERIQRDPSAVAYEQAAKAYERNPSEVDHQLDRAARKQQAAQGGGGKGGGGNSPPPPSANKNSGEKISQYAQVLLEKDQKGTKHLPKEYDEYVTGYRYYLSWELGICMGPVDAFLALWTYPGESRVITNTGEGLTPDNDYTFTAAGPDQGGRVRFYPGRADQTRNVADVYLTDYTNYRGTCFLVMEGYYMGQSPSPPSFAAEVQRFPVCLDADGDVVAGIKVRGSAMPDTVVATAASWTAGITTIMTGDDRYEAGDKVVLAGFLPAGLNAEWTVESVAAGEIRITTTNPGAITAGTTRPPVHPSYHDANPAAILWEIMTNKVWGRGLDPDSLDAASFIQASEWCETNNVGMSFTLESQDALSEAVDLIRSHISMILVPIGGVIRCRVLLDRANAYDPVIKLNSDQVNNPSFSRPAWPSTVNELRVEFTNASNNYQPEIVLVQDDGNIATVGRINSDRLSLQAFSNRSTAERMARMLLGVLSSPLATLAFEMNRFETRLVPGDFVQFEWSEWSAGTTTTFWRVVEVHDQEMSDGGIMVTLQEDQFATPLETAATGDFTPPVPAYEGRTNLTDDDVILADDTRLPYTAGDMSVQVHELNIWQSDGDGLYFLTVQRTEGMTAAVNVFWRVDGSTDDYENAGRISPWAIHGTLQTAIPANGRTTARGAAINITLELASERARFLEYCNVCPTAAEDLDRATGSETNWLIIGGELWIVAMAEAGAGPADVVVTAYVRGQYGTDREAHAVDAPVAFIYQFIPQVYTLRSDQIRVNEALEFQLFPISYDNKTAAPVSTVATLTDRARKALAVQRWEAAAIVDDWTVAVWPRWHNRGADSVGDLEEVLATESREIPVGYEFWVEPLDVSDVSLADPVRPAVTYFPDPAPGTDPTAGRITFDFTAPAGTVTLRFYQSYNGILGTPTAITL